MFAMLVDSDTYAPSLVKFLNRFSKEARNNTPEFNSYLARLFQSFLKAVEHLPDDTFINKGNNRINVALFESVFYAASKGSFASEELISHPLNGDRVRELETDAEFVASASANTTSTRNVKTRLQRGITILTES